jgi:hypothetical protein
LGAAGALASVVAVGEGALQPASVSAAADISDKTILRMGKPRQTMETSTRENRPTRVRPSNLSRIKREA